MGQHMGDEEGGVVFPGSGAVTASSLGAGARGCGVRAQAAAHAAIESARGRRCALKCEKYPVASAVG